MPKRPAPGCPNRAVAHGFCEPCAPQQGRVAYQLKGSRAERGYPADWEKRRLRILARDPVCRGCFQALSSEVDHILPLERGGSNHDDNLQGLCKTCHSRKTGIEARDLDPASVMAAVRKTAQKDRGAAAAPLGGVKSFGLNPSGTAPCPKTHGREIQEGGGVGKNPSPEGRE